MRRATWPVRVCAVRLRWLLPAGGTLGTTEWYQRHVVLLWLLCLHAPLLFILGLATGNAVEHSALEAVSILPWAVLTRLERLSRRYRACAASLGLLSASAVLVHLTGGMIEAHFHFFVMIAVIALYQDWLPFLVALLFVVFEHGLGGVLLPFGVYNHPDAIANPWKWAAIHGMFVLTASAAQVAHWRLSELHQHQRLRAQRVLRENRRTLATLMSNLPGMAYRCSTGPRRTMEFVSEGCQELTGYSQSDLVRGKIAFGDLVHAQDRQRVWAGTAAALRSHQPYRYEYRITTATGSERWVWEQGRGVYGEDGQLRALEGFITDITERHQAEVALGHQAQHDPLTDLPNRALLRQELQEALTVSRRTGTPVALLLMDLDRFKEVNDTFGHQWGDDVLQTVGQRLLTTLGETGMLARLGGDEFGILLRSGDVMQASRVAQQLVDALDTPVELGGQSMLLGASIGIAVSPEHGAEAEALLRKADVAMYVAKRSGSGFALYSADQDQHSANRLALVGELRQAIDTGQLVLHYQPIVDCALGRIAGVEALVRWNHPQHGLLAPDRFIPLAEQSGTIKLLTLQVLRMALRQCRLWQERGMELMMSVNLSMRNVHDPQLPWTIGDLLRAEGVPASRLRLEITESTIMADPTRAIEVLERLRDLGTTIAVDDFGTGYSSLSYLKRLPVDNLKIDKSFVQRLASDASDRAIVCSAVELGHNLGLRVVAEGVEDPTSLRALVALGCDLAQGYYLGRPGSAEALDRWLTESAWGFGSGQLPKAA